MLNVAPCIYIVLLVNLVVETYHTFGFVHFLQPFVKFSEPQGRSKTNHATAEEEWFATNE